MILELLEISFALFLVLGIPVLSWRTIRSEALRLAPRAALYFSAAVSQWIVAALGVTVVVLARLKASELGFQALPLRDFAGGTLALAAISLALIGLLLWLDRRGWWPEESELLDRLIPQTRREKLWAVLALAPTAALCEEFLYRGFLFSQIAFRLHSSAWAVALSSAAFGLAHCYQGISGMARAAALGLLLAWPVAHWGSLYPSMAAHFIIDAAGFGWLGPRFLRKAQ